MPVRMALISLLLGIKGKSLHKFEGGFERKQLPLYDQPRSIGMPCTNTNCIVHDPMEAQYVRNKFYVIRNERDRRRLQAALRLLRERHRGIRGREQKEQMVHQRCRAAAADPGQHFKELVVFANDADAVAAGFHSRRGTADPKVAHARCGGRAQAALESAPPAVMGRHPRRSA